MLYFFIFLVVVFLLFSRCENKSTTKIKYELNPDIGVTTPNCPYCGKELKKFPGKKTKCKNCENYIYVRTRAYDEQKILIKEDEIEEVSIEWEKKTGTFEWKEKERNKSLLIDVSKEMNQVINYLSSHYIDYCNYEEILSIKEEDRLILMQKIWKNYNFRGTEKDIIKEYPQYNKENLHFICIKEMARVFTFFHWKEDIKRWGSKNILVKIHLYDDWRTRFCDISDEINVFNTWNDEDEIINNSLRIWCGGSIDTEYVYFYQNGEYLKMTPNEFKRFCNRNGYKSII